jgi:hypothetical protein
MKRTLALLCCGISAGLVLFASPTKANACSVNISGPTTGVKVIPECNSHGLLTMVRFINRSTNTYQVLTNGITKEDQGIAGGTNHVLPTAYNDGTDELRLWAENPGRNMGITMKILPGKQ